MPAPPELLCAGEPRSAVFLFAVWLSGWPGRM